MYRLFTMVAWPLLACLSLTCSGDDENAGPRSQAHALSGAFTDRLTFEGGSVETGDPPHSDVPGPRITRIRAPRSIGPAEPGMTQIAAYDTWFDVILESEEECSDVVAVIIHVFQANKDDQAQDHFRIDQIHPSGNRIDLRARIAESPDLGGNAFQMRVGLVLTDGGVTPYAIWSLVIQPVTGQATTVPLCTCQANLVEVSPSQLQTHLALEQTNLSLLGKNGCRATAEGDIFVDRFEGTGISEQTQSAVDAEPCVLWGELIGLDEPAEAGFYPFPSGTILQPDGLRMWNLNTISCAIRIDCDRSTP